MCQILKVTKCVQNVSEIWGLADVLWEKSSWRSLSWILHRKAKTGTLFSASAPMPPGARETETGEFSDISTSAGPLPWPWHQYFRCLYQCACKINWQSAPKIFTKEHSFYLTLSLSTYQPLALLRWRPLRSSQKRIYTQPFPVKHLKRQKTQHLLHHFLPFFVCLLLFHRYEWSCFPLSCSHLSRSWHQTRSTQVCSNQSQLVMDTKHPVKEL